MAEHPRDPFAPGEDPGAWPNDEFFATDRGEGDCADPEWFADAVDDALGADERARCEAMLAADPALAARFESYRREVQTLRALGAVEKRLDGGAALRARILADAARELPAPTPRAANRFAWVASVSIAAASVVLFFALQGEDPGVGPQRPSVAVADQEHEAFELSKEGSASGAELAKASKVSLESKHDSAGSLSTRDPSDYRFARSERKQDAERERVEDLDLGRPAAGVRDRMRDETADEAVDEIAKRVKPGDSLSDAGESGEAMFPRSVTRSGEKAAGGRAAPTVETAKLGGREGVLRALREQLEEHNKARPPLRDDDETERGRVRSALGRGVAKKAPELTGTDKSAPAVREARKESKERLASSAAELRRRGGLNMRQRKAKRSARAPAGPGSPGPAGPSTPGPAGSARAPGSVAGPASGGPANPGGGAGGVAWGGGRLGAPGPDPKSPQPSGNTAARVLYLGDNGTPRVATQALVATSVLSLTLRPEELPELHTLLRTQKVRTQELQTPRLSLQLGAPVLWSGSAVGGKTRSATPAGETLLLRLTAPEKELVTSTATLLGKRAWQPSSETLYAFAAPTQGVTFAAKPEEALRSPVRERSKDVMRKADDTARRAESVSDAKRGVPSGDSRSDTQGDADAAPRVYKAPRVQSGTEASRNVSLALRTALADLTRGTENAGDKSLLVYITLKGASAKQSAGEKPSTQPQPPESAGAPSEAPAPRPEKSAPRAEKKRPR